MLVELTTVAAGALPVAAFREHLRLGSGFADDGAQDALLETYLRAAIAAIEGRIGKALLARDFAWRLDDWRDAEAQALPLAPVSALASVVLRDAAGGETAVDPATWRLVPDLHRPRLTGVGGLLPTVPVAGFVTVTFTAGFGTDWVAVPADLRQAVFLLAADYHEHRNDGGGAAGLPFAVLPLIARWRTVRLLGGAGA